MILGKSVLPAEGEVSVKTYQCTEFNSKVFGIHAKGYLEVTNKRLLFQALGTGMGGWSVIHNEVAISDVSQVKIYKGNSFNLKLFIIGMILAIAVAGLIKGVMSFSENSSTGTIIALAIVAGAGYWLYKQAQRVAYSLIIDTKGSGGNVVSIGGMSPFTSGGAFASKALDAAPAQDSEILFKEIGAVVLDIQNMGENAIEKWKK